jgi:hypothetical protein
MGRSGPPAAVRCLSCGAVFGDPHRPWCEFDLPASSTTTIPTIATAAAPTPAARGWGRVEVIGSGRPGGVGGSG